MGYIENEKSPFTIAMDWVYSFEILREQTISEIKRVDTYMRSSDNNNSFELNNDLTEIIIECSLGDYLVLDKVFDGVKILHQEKDILKIKLKVSEDAFIHWYLSYLLESVTIIKPQGTKEKIVSQAQAIIRKYGGRD